jgi:hypothetical protein
LEALKAAFVVLYRSIFDLVRELLTQETLSAEARMLNKYLKPDLLIIGRVVLSALNTASSSLVNFFDTLNYLYCSRGTGLVKHSNALRITRGAIAVSDNGTGTIVGWCFGFGGVKVVVAVPMAKFPNAVALP